jgi:hypothetical protein
MATSQTESATAASRDCVSGVLNYLADKDQHPVSYNLKPPPGVPARTATYSRFTVPIHSARPILSELSLDKRGFAVTRQNTAVANFYDPEEVRLLSGGRAAGPGIYRGGQGARLRSQRALASDGEAARKRRAGAGQGRA